MYVHSSVNITDQSFTHVRSSAVSFTSPYHEAFRNGTRKDFNYKKDYKAK